MTSLAWPAASRRAALCCWANSLERPPGFPETPGSQLGLPALPIFVQFALKLNRLRCSLAFTSRKAACSSPLLPFHEVKDHLHGCGVSGAQQHGRARLVDQHEPDSVVTTFAAT